MHIQWMQVDLGQILIPYINDLRIHVNVCLGFSIIIRSCETCVDDDYVSVLIIDVITAPF